MSRKAKRETTDWYSALTEYLFFFKYIFRSMFGQREMLK